MVVLNKGIDYAQFQEFHEVVSLEEKAACVRENSWTQLVDAREGSLQLLKGHGVPGDS
jgi:hypothetical protein